ncbi:MliC family protein [Loktanella fryxellensis]|uniref:MliC family protein n=1 Tax=Loktanella fryxellensis TaxID=245187 RepID=UPI001FE1DA83|nr:MliC family protein [Loktanella fryxellensis]
MAQTYTCDRGVDVPVVYVNAEDGTDFSIVVLMVEGRMINLQATGEAASGVRYRFPNDGSGYVWWTHQGEASLYWRDGATSEETAIYTGCAPA